MSVQNLVVKEKHFVALIFPDIKRDRLRLIFSYNGRLRIVLWLKIGADGSLYLNDRLAPSEKPSKSFRSKAVADGNGGFSKMTVPYAKFWNDIPVDSQKISTHSSGLVKGYGHYDWGTSTRNLTSRTLIQANQYTKPERYENIDKDKLKNTDIVVPVWDGSVFELDNEKPLMCRVYAEPLKAGKANIEVLQRPNTPNQSALIFPATNLKNKEGDPIQDIDYQLYFFNEKHNSNPDYTFISFAKT